MGGVQPLRLVNGLWLQACYLIGGCKGVFECVSVAFVVFRSEWPLFMACGRREKCWFSSEGEREGAARTERGRVI